MPVCSQSCRNWPPVYTKDSPCSICVPEDPERTCYDGKVGRPLGRKYGDCFSLRFTKEQREALKKLSEKKGKSEHETLRELVEEAFVRA